jgi:YaiO family outer membrane protein
MNTAIRFDPLRIALTLAAIACCAKAYPAADAGVWSVEARTEPSAVSIGPVRTTWWTNRLLAEYRYVNGNVFFAGETQRRGSETNTLLSGGGYRRFDDWIVTAEGAAGIDPVFVPRVAFDGRLARRLIGNTWGRLGYQYLDYPLTHVQLWTASFLRYQGGNEFEASLKYGRNQAFNHEIQVVLLRGLWDDGSAISYGAIAAVGRNLFDVLAVPVEGGRGWTANVNARYRLDDQNSIRLDLGIGYEAPSFHQRTVALSYKKSF